MGVCGVYGCHFTNEDILTFLDNKERKVALCPNHSIMFVNKITTKEIYTEPSKRKDNNVCECCGHEHSIEYKDMDVTFYLCDNHLKDLINLNLSPEDFKTLYKKAGNVYILHGDFYDAETGEALQPKDI